MRAALATLLLAASLGVFAADGDSEFRLGKATLRAGNAGGALKFFQQAAEKGHAEAMHHAGLMYLEGRGVEADRATAAQWFQRGAEKGYAPSMNHYANWLRDAKPEEALQWHRKAAEAGEPFAMENLANAYRDGIGTPKDLLRAADWFRKAAEAGSHEAMLTYGYMLSHGEGVPLDIPKAFAMYLASARAGNTAAMFIERRIVSVQLEHDDAVLPETAIQLVQVAQRSRHQSGPEHEHQTQRHLHNDQRSLTPSPTPRRGGSFALQGSGGVDP
jgi:TPR repeat protein